MFPAIDPIPGPPLAETAGEETMCAVLAVEWNDPDQRGNMLAGRLRTRTKHAVLSTLRTDYLTTHSTFVSSMWCSMILKTAL